MKNTYVPLPDEPKGWHRLQQLALAERDTNKLNELLKRMNELLTRHEYAAEIKSRDRKPNLKDQASALDSHPHVTRPSDAGRSRRKP